MIQNILEFIKNNGKDLISEILTALVVGLVIFWVGNRAEKRKLKADAIRELMTHRGDHTSSDFRKALNKISIIFHDQKDILFDVRQLYEAINDPGNTSEKLKRKIVGLIYKLCRKNGFKGLSEYDIDQAFPESKQTPLAENEESAKSITQTTTTPTPSLAPTTTTSIPSLSNKQ